MANTRSKTLSNLDAGAKSIDIHYVNNELILDYLGNNIIIKENYEREAIELMDSITNNMNKQFPYNITAGAITALKQAHFAARNGMVSAAFENTRSKTLSNLDAGAKSIDIHYVNNELILNIIIDVSLLNTLCCQGPQCSKILCKSHTCQNI